MVSGNPYHNDYGGVDVHVKNLIQKLSENKEIELMHLTFNEKNSTSEKGNLQIISLKRMRLGTVLFPLQVLYDRYRLKKKIKQIKPDLVHIQSTVPTFSLLGINIAKKIPTILTLHGYLTEEYKIQSKIKKLFYKFICVPIEKKALSKIPYIITVCPQIKDIIKRNTNSKIFVIPNGVDLEHINRIKPTKKYDYHTIFFLGMLTKGKGVSDLIKTIPEVQKKINNIKLFIGGIGPYEHHLKQLVIEHNLEDRVKFLGFLDEVEKFSVMKSIDLFVLPSYWESFPVVLPEAMACGKPIITTNIAGNPYAVTNEENGFLIEPGDTKDLADKIIYLLKNEKIRREMGKASLMKSYDFNWNGIAQQTKKVYEKILQLK